MTVCEAIQASRPTRYELQIEDGCTWTCVPAGETRAEAEATIDNFRENGYTGWIGLYELVGLREIVAGKTWLVDACVLVKGSQS